MNTRIFKFFPLGIALLFFASGWMLGLQKIEVPGQAVYGKVVDLTKADDDETLAHDARLFAEKLTLANHLASKYKQPDDQVREIVEAAYTEAKRHSLSPLLVLAVIEKESSLRVSVSNSYGAMGLMQVVPRFHPEKLDNPEDPKELLTTEGNIRVGSEIVAEYLRSKKGNLQAALVKYSGNARDYYPKVMRFKEDLRKVLQRDHRERT